MSDSRKRIDRRSFLAGSAALLGGAAIAPTASSYDRILGANARISLAHIGPGSRGQELAWVVAQHRTRHNVEMTAVCDLWRLHRERAVAENTRFYGRSPRSYQYLEDVLALQDVDAVIISTPEHSHSPILKMAVEAGKDVYVEKPMGNVLEETKAAREATKRNKRIVQVGTQHRSEPYPQAARDVVQSGTLGDVSKIEIVWNYHGQRWRGREETKQVREQDSFFFQAEDGIRDLYVTGVQTCALPISGLTIGGDGPHPRQHRLAWPGQVQRVRSPVGGIAPALDQPQPLQLVHQEDHLGGVDPQQRGDRLLRLALVGRQPDQHSGLPLLQAERREPLPELPPGLKAQLDQEEGHAGRVRRGCLSLLAHDGKDYHLS